MADYYEYKKEVLEYARKLSSQGFFGTATGTGGNVSLRIDGEDAVAVTPSSLKYDEITPDDICIVNSDFELIEGPHNPSVETKMHLAVYKHRLDANAVIHTHQINASVFTLINKGIPALFDEAALAMGPEADIVPYALSGSPELIDNLIAKLDNRCSSYLLQNHGVVSLGVDLAKAYHCTELLEKTAKIYLAALATGQEVTTLPDDMVELLFLILKSEQDKEITRKKGETA